MPVKHYFTFFNSPEGNKKQIDIELKKKKSKRAALRWIFLEARQAAENLDSFFYKYKNNKQKKFSSGACAEKKIYWLFLFIIYL